MAHLLSNYCGMKSAGQYDYMRYCEWEASFWGECRRAAAGSWQLAAYQCLMFSNLVMHPMHRAAAAQVSAWHSFSPIAPCTQSCAPATSMPAVC
jgi:hypothetical protein